MLQNLYLGRAVKNSSVFQWDNAFSKIHSNARNIMHVLRKKIISHIRNTKFYKNNVLK